MKGRVNRRLRAAMIFALGVLGGDAIAQDTSSTKTQSGVTAIDIALEPDAVLTEHAESANARLREAYPKGFELDSSHRPHITLLQCYVHTVDLDKIYAAAGRLLASDSVAAWRLRAYKYYSIPNDNLGLAGIVVKPTDRLIELQQKLIDAVAPFVVNGGSAAAFVTTPDDPDINEPTVDYVENFVAKATGKNFNPHVTVGIATQEYLKAMLAEPFPEFSFSPAGAAVYQLGNFGTARKLLKTLDLND